MVDNGYSMYEDILNFPKKVVELGGGGRKENVIFHTFVNLRSALSLRIEEEKESLIYIVSQATFQPPPPPHLNILICGQPVLTTINDGYIQLSFPLKTNTRLFLSVIGIYHLEHYFNITVESPCATMSHLSDHLS